jgi:hypothetical protein
MILDYYGTLPNEFWGVMGGILALWMAGAVTRSVSTTMMAAIAASIIVPNPMVLYAVAALSLLGKIFSYVRSMSS